MCKVNPITKEQIEQAKSSLLKRIQDARTTHEQRLLLQEQYDYIANNVRERLVNERGEEILPPAPSC